MNYLIFSHLDCTPNLCLLDWCPLARNHRLWNITRSVPQSSVADSRALAPGAKGSAGVRFLRNRR